MLTERDFLGSCTCEHSLHRDHKSATLFVSEGSHTTPVIGRIQREGVFTGHLDTLSLLFPVAQDGYMQLPLLSDQMWLSVSCRRTRDDMQGRIIIHEMLYDDDKTGPFTVAAFSVAMLPWTEGEQYSGHELSTMLTEAGFTDIEVKPTWEYWSIGIGEQRNRKPG